MIIVIYTVSKSIYGESMKVYFNYLLVLLMVSGTAHSQKDEFAGDIFSLSLMDLVNMDVTIVSKREESVSMAAGVVSVITSDEIQSYGATNLKDVLLRMPNFYMFDSSTFKASGMMLRGGATQHLNNHVLYLINGRPLRESQNGGLHSDINLMFPVERIKRLEIIRGPGSVLYGSNAFNGVLNIITREAPDELEVSVKTQNGTAGYGAHSIQVGGQLTDDSSFNLHGKILDHTGDNFSAFDEGGSLGTQENGLDGEFLNLELVGYGFTLNAFNNNIVVPAVSGAFLWSNRADFELNREFYDLSYQYDLSSDWGVAANFTSNQLDRLVFTESGGFSEFASEGYISEITINGSISESLNMVAGVSSDVVKGNLYTRGGEYRTERHSLYGQLEYLLSEKTRLTAGVQWNKPDGDDLDASPRLALVHRYSDQWHGKLLYAKAFRSPYGSELYFESGFLEGNDSLDPESIETAEAQLIFGDESLSLTTTVYYSEAENLIERALVGSANTFINQPEKVYYSGVEVEWNKQVNETMRFQGSFSHQMNEDESGQDDVMAAANEMLKLGFTYRPNKQLVLGIWSNYFGAASKLEDLEGSSAQVVNPASEAVNLISLNVETNLGYLLENEKYQTVQVSLYANNLLDEDVWYPELGRRLVNTFPQNHSQGIYAAVEVSF